MACLPRARISALVGEVPVAPSGAKGDENTDPLPLCAKRMEGEMP
jgi:hypothetical protein